MYRASWHGAVLAESADTVLIEGNQYFPPDAVNRSYFSDSATTSQCPWKGSAQYYSVSVDGETNVDAAWYYPEPKDAAAEIRNHVAFWNGVLVEQIP